MKKLYYYLLLLLIIITNFESTAKASDQIDFVNTFSYQLISTNLDHEWRENDKCIIEDKPSYLNERFQTFIYPDPTTVDLFYGINFHLIRNENCLENVGFELQAGYGKSINPLFIIGFGLSYQNDLVFNSSSKYNTKTFVQIGYNDDIHCKFDFEGLVFILPIVLDLQIFEIDLALGWKDAFPLFLRYNLEHTGNLISTIYDKQYFRYITQKHIFHLQYYGDILDFSCGFIIYEEKYFMILEPGAEDQGYSLNSSFDKKIIYKGAGLTFNYKNFFEKKISVFATFDLLRNNSQFISIYKVGTKFNF